MSRAFSWGVQKLCLVFGIVEGLGAALWCLGGAGIYGSPLSGMRGPELAYVGALLLMGPFSAFLASIIVLWDPRRGAAWLIVGGVGSSVLAVPFIFTDAFVFPLALAALPMYLMGRWLLRTATDPNGGAGAADRAVDSRGELLLRGSVLVGPVLFLIGAIGIYIPFYGLIEATNISGLRGKLLRNPTNDYEYFEYQGRSDSIVLLLMVAGVALVSTMRKRLHVRVEALAGMWLELPVAAFLLFWLLRPQPPPTAPAVLTPTFTGFFAQAP